MSTVIEFLEQLGSAAADTGPAAYAAAVDALPEGAEVRSALHRRDAEALARLVGGRGRMFCLVAPAEDEEQPVRDEPEEGDGEGETREAGPARLN